MSEQTRWHRAIVDADEHRVSHRGQDPEGVRSCVGNEAGCVTVALRFMIWHVVDDLNACSTPPPVRPWSHVALAMSHRGGVKQVWLWACQ